MNFFNKEHIKNSYRLLRWSLFGGAVYFFLISSAHLFGLKIPILFIYFNVPSYIYQDNIIAFLSFGFGMFLYAGYASVKRNDLFITKYIIIAGLGVILGLININSFTDFSSFEREFSVIIKVSHFWSETGIVIIYIAWIALLYLSAVNSKKQKQKEVPKSFTEISHNEQKDFIKFR
jgi:hypothetical protein